MRVVSRRALLGVFCLFTALSLQFWVGGATIYAPRLASARLELHTAILGNSPPSGRTWEQAGARNTNTRVGAVYLAEAVHRLSGASVARRYWLVDTLALCAALVLLYVFLAQWFDPAYSALGLLYFVSILPLTYFLHYFHPWDRLSIALWILIAFYVRRNRPIALAVAIAIAMVVKYDAVVAPGLYWLAHVGRAHFWRITFRSLLLSVLSFGILFALLAMFPGGSSERTTGHALGAQLLKNVHVALAMGPSYPPLLVHVLPGCLALYGWRRADHVARAFLLFGLAILVPVWLVATNFQEVRAELALVVLMLPAALFGVRRLLDDGHGAPALRDGESADTRA